MYNRALFCLTSLTDLINLNVGGETFTCFRETLVSEPQGLLAELFSPISNEQDLPQDQNGAFFIDRDPQVFRVVLSYLRLGIILS